MSLTDRWFDWWFPPSSGFRLAVCRIVVVATQLFLFMPGIETQIARVERSEQFINPQWLIALLAAFGPDEVLFSAGAFHALYMVTIVAGVMCLIGLLTRPSAFVFALGNWIMISHIYSYGEEHHTDAIIGFFLMLLAFSPSGRRLSIDALLRRTRRATIETAAQTVDTAVWPLKLVQILIAWSYLSNGLAKLAYGGLEWMNGYTMQQYLLSAGVRFGLPLGVELAGHHTLAVLMSIGTILFEIFFFVAVLFPKTAPYFLMAGVLLHVGIYLTMGADFFQQIVMYIVFIDFDRLERRWQESRGRRWAPAGAPG